MSRKRDRSPSFDHKYDSDSSPSRASKRSRASSPESRNHKRRRRDYDSSDDDDDEKHHERRFAKRVQQKAPAAVRPIPIREFVVEEPPVEEEEDEPEDEKDEKEEELGTGPCAGNLRRFNIAFEKTYGYYKKKRDAHLASKRLRRREEISTDELRDIANGQGDIRLANVRRTMEMWPVVRVPYQRLFHDYIIKSCLPKIYGSEWEANSIRVMEEHNMDKIDYEILITTARRMGKTFSVSMLTASLLLNVPGIRIIIVSTGGRASSSLTETVKKFIEMTPGGKERIIRDNAEQLFLAPEGYDQMTKEQRRKQVSLDTTSKLLSFPSNSTGNTAHHITALTLKRGGGGNNYTN